MSLATPGLRLLKFEPEPRLLRFGPFELDTRTAELRRAGARVKLQLQPARVLALLASQPGRLHTREEIQQQVWSDGTYVDFEQSLNFCIRQIRAALGDHAGTPRYVETLPRRGYRFIAPVDSVPLGEQETPPHGTPRPELTPQLEGAPAAELADAAAPTPAAERPPRRSARPLAIGLGLAAAALSAWAVPRLIPAPKPPEFQRLTYRRGSVQAARFASDGQIVYVAAFEDRGTALFAGRPESRDPRPLAVGYSRLVGLSSAGEVAFIEGRVLSRAPLTGGPAKPVLESVRSADWDRSGTQFAVARSDDSEQQGRFRIEYPIGHVLGEGVQPSHLRVSPDGSRVAFLEHPVPFDDRGYVVVIDADGARRQLSSEFGSIEGLAWAPEGREVWFTAARSGVDAAIHAVDLAGVERTLVPAMGRLVLHDVAPDGRALVERSSLRLEIRFRGPADASERDLSWFDFSGLVELTPDGRQILFYESGEAGGPDYTIFLRQTDGSPPVRLGPGRAMGLSPDGRFVLAIPLRQPDRLTLLPVGAGETRTLRHAGVERYLWAGFLPDGRLLVTASSKDGGLGTFVSDPAGRRLEPVTPPGVGVFERALSPDGSRVVAQCGEVLCIYPLAGGAPRPVPGWRHGLMLYGWRADGKALLVSSSKQPSLELAHLDLATGALSPWRTVGPDDPAGAGDVMSFAATPDGSAYAYGFHRELSDLYLVSGLR
jgi:DNA-binding winged helix-turn-helix (wHTH) protein/WD40 repeat protein